MQNPQEVQLSTASLRELLPPGFTPSPKSMGVVAGTGLSGLAENLGEEIARVPFAKIAGFPQTGVTSHAGEFSARLVNGTPLLAQLGRFHLYEGHSPAVVCLPVRVMISLGFKTIIVTNAAGALNPNFSRGSLMLIRDVINFTGASPLGGANYEPWGERFPDMSAPFDPELCALAQKLALNLKIRLENGVYIGVRGPQMETPAETRAFRILGADAVGMSSVLEVIAARHMGARILGFSCLTNVNLPDCMEPAPLSDVISAANACGAPLGSLITAVCENMKAPATD